MPRRCGPGEWVDFTLTDRDQVIWSSSGLSMEATAQVELENSGTWWDLTIDTDNGDLTGYFAGPGHLSPAPAHVVPVTSHVRIHIVDGGVDRTLDGGFIRLVT